MVWQGDHLIPASRWTRRAATALFTSLLSAPGYRLHREQVSDWLWPEAEPAALRVYQALATALEADLDVAPNGAIEALRARLLAQEAVPRAADRPPRVPPTTTPTNLPAPLTGFMGRAWERHEVADILAATRLLTLTGPGGCGKMRLALEVAGALVETYPIACGTSNWP
jgi:hypothetical protein